MPNNVHRVQNYMETNARELCSRTPEPPAGRKSIPAFASAFSTAEIVLTLESTLAFSNRVTAFSDTTQTSARNLLDYFLNENELGKFYQEIHRLDTLVDLASIVVPGIYENRQTEELEKHITALRSHRLGKLYDLEIGKIEGYLQAQTYDEAKKVIRQMRLKPKLPIRAERFFQLCTSPTL
jgi:hypothetical protein